ncbi:hypothetical protein halTADL_1351 [Halohasta litchfieldiae]|jgi:hypothetical protein|uniref:Lipoprotein n=1 Tax=Halohasta litchfieldiae TaxID=1073996 RepID=A0A1H6X4H5_9EURY|nr:hypothetical protein halTADL_1351 [Halohasta litchfieldiae]SEJ22956.1 hypothetical protein SAMN05444271_1334 [Halohasta litchfieldiae]
MSRLVSLLKLLKLTMATHTLLAGCVFVHSRLTDQSAGIWLPLTLIFGLFGVAGYLLDR